jgi:hypothetical protein
MITKVSVCLEVGPRASGAFAPEYPGCWVYGRTEKIALREVKNNVFEWFDWAKRHGESVPDVSDDLKIETIEMAKVDYDPSEAYTPEPLFWCEVAPVKKEDIEKTIRLMGYSRQDLLNTIASVNESIMDWQPPVKLRPIRDCLIHIARAELWYITRLNIEITEKLPENHAELLDYSRKTVTESLKSLPERKMKGIFQPRKYRSPVCNLWTARKVLRRIVDHEMLHIRDIRRVLELSK